MSASIPGPRRRLEPLVRTRLYGQVAEQINGWIEDNSLKAGDRVPPERELAQQLGVSRATLSQALVALEVLGVVEVRHGDGTVVTGTRTGSVMEGVRLHTEGLPDIIDTRDALETKLASLAAVRRTDDDLARIDASLRVMAEDIARGGRGVKGDELFHAAVTAAAHAPLMGQLMAEISERILETRIESLSQPGRPANSLAGHTRVADAIRAEDPKAAAEAMHDHVMMVSDIALLREEP